MKINAAAPLLTLNGKPYQADEKDIRIGQVIADTLAVDQSGGKFKMYNLAQKFFNDDEVEVDAADLILIKKAVEDSKQYNNVILGQILGILENIK